MGPRKRKRKLTANQAKYVDELTEEVLELLLEFKFESDVAGYFLTKMRSDWRETEYELRDYPVKGFGVVFRKLESEAKVSFVEQSISPEKAVEYVGTFPLEAAAINYVFTLVELYGDLLVQRTNAKFFKGKRRHKNWHHKVYGNADTKDPAIRLKMANGFGHALLVNGRDIDSDTVLKLIELKRARNAFAHDADTGQRFEVLFRYAVDVIRDVYFLLREDRLILIATPFDDDEEQLESAREENFVLDNMDNDQGE